MKKYGLLLALMLFGAPTTGFSATVPWYAGASGGVSSLRPETENSPFTLNTSVSFGAGAFAGYDFSNRISLELGYTYLGGAELSNDNGTTSIGYSALSGSGLLYVYGDARNIADRSGFAGYVRLGVSSMDNSASIPLEREDNVAILAGAGFEFPLTTDLNFRGELTSFDGDAQAAFASIVYRPQSQFRRRATPAPAAPDIYQAPQQQPGPVYQTPSQRQPAPQVYRAPQQQNQPQQPRRPVLNPAPQQQQRVPTYGMPVTDSPIVGSGSQNTCAAPVYNEPADLRGCALFSGKLRGVEFVSGTASLTPIASKVLDRLAQNMLRYRNIVIEIHAHTESFGSAARANQIATQRTITVAQHLAKRGVPVQRLRARAFGHTKPVAIDNTLAGRRQNNRIELRVLR